MWLKVHYPADFYAVLMTLEPEKAPRAIKESSALGMSVVGPDVNLSKTSFTVEHETGTLRYGLEAIDGVGSTSAAQVVERAPYESLEHFDMSHSFKYSKCNKGHRKALLEAGALDLLGGRTGWSESEKAATEMRRLRISLRPGGTFGDDEPLILSCAHSQEELEALRPGEAAVVAGIVDEVRELKTKRGRNPGQKMCKMMLRFGLDTFSVTLFPASYAEYVHLLHKDAKLIIRGKIDDRGQGQVIGLAVMGVSEFLASQREQAEPIMAIA
jgi:DNA polymerase III alpha subunit